MRRGLVALCLLAAAAVVWLTAGGGRAERPDRSPLGTAGGNAERAASRQALDSGHASAEQEQADALGPGPPVPDGEVSAQVVDSEGRPVAGATVEAYPPDGLTDGASPAGAARTDALGRTPWIGDGTVWLRAAKGEAASLPALQSPGGSPVTLTLRPARALHGTVLGPDGAPVESAALSFVVHHPTRTTEFFNGRTDAAGRFAVPPLPEDWLHRIDVDVDPPSPLPRGVFAFRRADLGEDDLVLRLSSKRLRGRVLGAGDAPVEDAVVLGVPPGATNPAAYPRIATTDDMGVFDAPVASPPFDFLLVLADGYAPRILEPEPMDADAPAPYVVLRAGIPLEGRVRTADGQPVGGATVGIEHPNSPGRTLAEMATEPDGSFAFAAVDSADHVLSVRLHEGHSACMEPLRVERVRGGPGRIDVVMPERIFRRILLVDGSTGGPATVTGLALVLRAHGTQAVAARRSWPPYDNREYAEFVVWTEGTYDLTVHSTSHRPALEKGLRLVRDGPEDIVVPLFPP